MRLKRDISKTNLLLLSIGSIVGSGWLFSSFYTVQIAGPAALFSWIIGAVCIGIVGLTFAELSTMLPISGSSIAFATITHGKMTGAIFGWITWLWTLVIAPIETQAVIQYSSNYISNLTYNQNSAEVLTTKGYIFATIIMLIFSCINVVGVKVMAETNKFVVFWKLIIPTIVAVLLLTVKINPSNLTSAGGFAPYGFNGIFSAIAIGGISFSFFGFQTPIFLAGEAQNPQKSIPFALFGSLFACVILYLLLQLGFILSIDPASLANGWNKISFIGDAGPFAGIFLALGFSFMVKMLYLDAIISPAGTGVGYVAVSSRILYSMSLQKDAPKIFSKLNYYSTPWVSVLTNFIVGMLFFLPFSGWQSMVAFLSAAIVITLACGPICLPIFRRNFPELPRPFKLPYAHFISFLSFYICNLMLQWTGWDTVWKLEIAVLLGIIVFIFSYFYNKNSYNLNLKSFTWLILYLLFSGVISYLGTFGGGKGLISMEWSFWVIAMSSGIIYFIAQKMSLNADESKKIFNMLLQEHQKI